MENAGPAPMIPRLTYGVVGQTPDWSFDVLQELQPSPQVFCIPFRRREITGILHLFSSPVIMGKYANVVAVGLIGMLCLLDGYSARNLKTEQAEIEQRQLLNILPSWLERIRNNLPSSLTGRSASVDVPAATKPAEVLNWPSIELDVGQITGVAVDDKSNPVILHRGNIKWDGGSFDRSGLYNRIADGPIKNDTIVTLDAATGSLIDHWGSNLFYMPHGLEVDANGNTWVTDVALHQVFKFPKGSQVPSLTLGEAFVSGSDDKHFCKPTDVVVSSSGIFFVSDGYCNKRILKFDADGRLLDAFTGPFNIVHSLTLMEEKDALCIADRENSRIVCIHAGLKEGQAKFGSPYGPAGYTGKDVGRVFAVAAKGQQLYAVFQSIFLGMSDGKTLDLDTLSTVSRWTPASGFGSPHDVAVSRDGEAMYIVQIGPNRIHKFALE
ncbi:peptidyl-alpha-hydroxyglycine alpha-amidating lyase 2-like isoform X2 [Daphnia carinata]|uniref:peptidyl-alpha-hydroxyglycine alpha-amidating lyase 2-like isoform X2 n=1 Tax=Daphnia carinata TaxID=120202 RepID=UPI0028697199|nr:peptidyl-alpha-hydroxyglycine alpha-amidating lyase 2-like isoform X2 [Daphnia carinata]